MRRCSFRQALVSLVVACALAGCVEQATDDLGGSSGKGDGWEADEEPGRWRLRFIDGDGNGADGVDVGDINGDGWPDVTSGWTESGELNLYLNPGPDFVTEEWPVADARGGIDVQGGIEDAVFADIDMDGRIDGIVSASEGFVRGIGMHWMPNRFRIEQPDLWRSDWLSPPFGALYLKATTGQIDGRFGADIVAGSRAGIFGDGAIVVYTSPENAHSFHEEPWQRYKIASLEKNTGVVIIDMNRDGYNDVLYTGVSDDGESPLRWRENPGGHMGDDWPGHTIDDSGLKDVVLCDMDRDGEDDILTATTRSGEGESESVAAWFRRLDDTGFNWERTTIRVAGGRPGDFAHKGIDCADFDGDGDMDLVLTGSGDGIGVYWLSNPGLSDDSPWSMHPVDIYREVMKYDNIMAADLDGDGDTDVVTTEENVDPRSRGLGVVWFENPLID